MQARYPTSPGNPSPAEIFAAYKDIPAIPGGPNSPSGMQILQNIVNQHKNDGLPNGSIALSVLNAANQAKPTPPMPQGTIADQVMAQANPPMDPNMMGLAAPGLEQFAQQQGMATGGLVALAHGGPVQGYAGRDGSSVHFSAQPPLSDYAEFYPPLGETTNPIVEEEYDDVPTEVPAVTYADIPVPGHMGGPNFGHVPRGMPKSDVMRSDVNEILHRMGSSGPGQRLQSIVDRITDTGHRWGARWDAAGEKLQARKAAAQKPATGGVGGPAHIADLTEALDLANANVALPYGNPAKGPATPVSFSPGIPSAAKGSSGSAAANPTVVVDTGDEGIPAATKPPEEKTTGGTSGKVPTLSTDDQIASLAKYFNGDHAKAAELKGQMEKRLASKENKDLITDIATGLGMMFSGQGTRTQAMGQGLMAFAAQHGRSDEEHDKLQNTIDAMTLQDEAQRNAATQAAAQTVFGAQTKSAQQHQAFLNEVFLAKLRNKGWVEREMAKAGSGYDHFSRKQSDIDQALANAQTRAQSDKDWPTLRTREEQNARIESYLPPDLRGMLGTATAGSPAQSNYNLPPGYGYTPG